MEEKHFRVEVICQQRVLYHVSASDIHTAGRVAEERWQRGDPTDLTGYDWCELQAVIAAESPDATSQSQDDALLLHLIVEREYLVDRLGATEGSNSDGLSAAQAASDLGWWREGSDGARLADTPRAAQSLQRLCDARSLVYFQRSRARAGERGEIRLYCTPGHLDRLSASLDIPPTLPPPTSDSAP